MNLTLKAKIVGQYGHQWKFARAIGIHDSLISKFVVGAREPNEEMRQKIAAGLGCRQEEIFPDTERAEA